MADNRRAYLEIQEGKYIAKALDVTALLGNEEELKKNQNMKVSFKGMAIPILSALSPI